MEKFFYALVGGIGGIASLALVAFMTEYLNPSGNYFSATIISITGFTLLGTCMIAAVFLFSPKYLGSFTSVFIGILVGGCLGGAVFPWGTFGYWISFILLGAVLTLRLHGISLITIKGGFWMLVSLIVMGILVTKLNFNEQWVSNGMVTYALTLGLLLPLESLSSTP